MGKYHKNLRRLTEIQIIYTLLSRPHTFEEIREKTKIHRNTLRSILNQFLEKDILISHKLSNDLKKLNNSKDAKPGSYYYIVNLDSIELQRIVLDPTPRYLMDQTFYEFSKKVPENMHIIIKRKLESLPTISTTDFCQKGLREKVEEAVRKSFLETIDDDYENQIKPSQLEEILEIKEINDFLREVRKTSEDIKAARDSMIKGAKSYTLKHLMSFQDKGMSKWDFLIYSMCLKETTEFQNTDLIYIAFLKVVKDWETKQ